MGLQLFYLIATRLFAWPRLSQREDFLEVRGDPVTSSPVDRRAAPGRRPGRIHGELGNLGVIVGWEIFTNAGAHRQQAVLD